MNIKWISLEQIKKIHTKQIELFGGDDGIRDIGIIESAMFAPPK